MKHNYSFKLRELTGHEIETLAKSAGLPANADLASFGAGVNDAVKLFHERLGEGTATQNREKIAELHKLATQVASGKLNNAVRLLEKFNALPSGVIRLLEERAERGLPLPTEAELTNASTTKTAARNLRHLLQYGAYLKEGRRRPGGKRSRPVMQPLYMAPPAQRHRPADEASQTLVMWLGVTYHEATGRLPPKKAGHHAPGPFVRLVRDVLHLLGIKRIDAVELVNRTYG